VPCRLLTALLALAALAASAAPVHAQDDDASRWSLRKAPFSLTIAGKDGARLTSIGGAAPLTYTDDAGDEHALDRVLSSRLTAASAKVTLAGADGPATARLTLAEAPGRIDVSVVIAPSSGVRALRVTLAAPASAHFVGSGERPRFVDLQRTVQPLKVWNDCGSSAPAPFFASTAGFGAFLRTAAVGRIAFPGAVDDTSFACDLSTPSCSVGPPAPAVRICVKSATARLELYEGTALQTVSAYVRRAGRPQAPWLPHFALMKWRDRVDGPQGLLDDIRQLRTRGLPVGWVILDNPWEAGADTGCFGSLQFDPSRYPDPAGLIAQVHRLDVRFMLWVSPQLKNKGCPPPEGYPNGWLTGDDEYYIRDLTVPDARADFVRRLGALAALGVDGFKADRGDEVDLEKTRLAGGSGVNLQNVYPRLYAQAVADAMKPYRRRWASLFRSATAGSPGLVPGFVGEDTTHSWNGLYDAVRMAQTASLAGEAMWGSDIGGYLGGEPTPLLFVRWAQFAATTPVFEVGGDGASATFWQLGRTAVEGFRSAATLHYELVPYLYELVREASVGGTPVLRPLGLGRPDDAAAWRSDTEYTVGDALLAAPVVTPIAGAVYLPAGTWIDYWSGERVKGARSIRRRRPATKLPLYVRAGAAFADNFRSPSLWASPWRPDDLARPGRQGWVVAPARGATAVARSAGTTLRATVSARGDVTISLRGAEHAQELRVHVPRRICRIEGLPHMRTAATLARSSGGWLRDPTRRGTVLVKAHVSRSATIELRACRARPSAS
jgi:alpha-glucosidase (family GH31 glycosyl hydrolase)